MQTAINANLGLNALNTVANDIVTNQSQDNQPPYLQPPPPQAPKDMAANVGIQVGAQVFGFLTTVVAPLLLPETGPIVGVLGKLLNIGGTLGATYGAAALNNSTSQMPTLVVPPDKDPKSSLITAASALQTQIIDGMDAQAALSKEPQFYYPVFSNVGLLRALANLNPLVLDSKYSDDLLGPNNPTSAALTNAAWKALLPSYFKWVPIDPTTESQSQNFDNFYPGATLASAGDAANQLAAMQLAAKPGATYQYPGFNEADQISTTNTWPPNNNGPVPAGLAPPTSMAIFPADKTSGEEAQHPERLFTLLEAKLTETGQFQWEYGDTGWVNYGNVFGYAQDGLYMSGWKLVDANGVEIDPRTAAQVFPNANNSTQPVTDGPEFAAFGGGWYLNVAPPSTPASGTYATAATWMDVYADWFHQSSLVPSSPVSGTLNHGGWSQDGNLSNGGNSFQVSNPKYSVSFDPIGNPVPSSFPFDNIADRGFEQVSVGTEAGGYKYDPPNAGWTFTKQDGYNGSGIAANGSDFTYLNPPAQEGTQVAFLQGTGSMSQSVTFGAAGYYQLEFSAAQRARVPNLPVQPFQQDFKVLIDDQEVVGIFTPSGTSYQTYTTAMFLVTAGNHTIGTDQKKSAASDHLGSATTGVVFVV
jgi:hypothetical protein